MSLPQLLVLSLTEIIGDFALKQYANRGGIMPLTVGTLGYIGVVGMLIVSLQGSTVLMVNNGWDGISAIIESIAAYIFLGERFHNWFQYMGVFFIISGLYLLKIPWSKSHPFHIPKL
jgi:multidrug transporter EmrE-like cation transporter